MTIKSLSIFLLTALCASVLAAQTSSDSSFGEVVQVTVVNIDVYVTDKDGNRVNGLRKDDFIVLEDRKPVQITNFEAVQGLAAAAASPVPATPGSPEASPPPPANPENALSLVVFVDNLHIRPEKRTRALEQIRKFLAANVRPGDRVMLSSHDLGLQTRQAFTDDLAAIDSSLKEMEKLPSFGIQATTARREALRTMLTLYGLQGCDYDIVNPVDSFAGQMQDQALKTVGALTLLVNSLSGVPGRKAVLYVSDGLPITPGEELFQALYELCSGGLDRAGLSSGSSGLEGGGGGRAAEFAAGGSGYAPSQALLDAQKYSLAQRFTDLTAHANAHRVTFYTLQSSGLSGFAAANADMDGDEGLFRLMTVQQVQTTNHQNSLNVMAADTGGRAILDVNNFLPELDRMREDFTSYYSLGYNPSHLGGGKQHRIEVKVKRPGVRVRYRKSYRDKPLMERMADRTLAALYHGLEDNPLAISVEMGDQIPGEDGRFSVPIQLKIPIFKLALLNQEGTYHGKLRLLVTTKDAKGGMSPVRQVEVPLKIARKDVLNAMGQHYLYTLTLRMAAGQQQVAVAVQDEISALTSYLSRGVTVGPVKASNGR